MDRGLDYMSILNDKSRYIVYNGTKFNHSAIIENFDGEVLKLKIINPTYNSRIHLHVEDLQKIKNFFPNCSISSNDYIEITQYPKSINWENTKNINSPLIMYEFYHEGHKYVKNINLSGTILEFANNPYYKQGYHRTITFDNCNIKIDSIILPYDVYSIYARKSTMSFKNLVCCNNSNQLYENCKKILDSNDICVEEILKDFNLGFVNPCALESIFARNDHNIIIVLCKKESPVFVQVKEGHSINDEWVIRKFDSSGFFKLPGIFPF